MAGPSSRIKELLQLWYLLAPEHKAFDSDLSFCGKGLDQYVRMQ